MIDTIKLSFDRDKLMFDKRDEWRIGSRENGVRRLIRRPSPSELKSGLYLPKLTLIERPTVLGLKSELTVEFSAPKLLKGNNFDELTDTNLLALSGELYGKMLYLGVDLLLDNIPQAKVTSIHYSKNILLNDAFGCQTVIDQLAKVESGRRSDVQKTNFREGMALHFHSNSKDLVFYDKLADLHRSKISDKRSVEKQSQIQHGLIASLELRTISVLRMELRLNGRKAIQRNLSKITNDTLSLKELFRSSVSQQILLAEWNKCIADIDLLSLDVQQPLEVLQNYMIEHPKLKPQAALSAVAGILVANQVGVSQLRRVIDANYKPHVWSRLKPLLKQPVAHRYQNFLQVSETLERFEPTSLDMLIKHKNR